MRFIFLLSLMMGFSAYVFGAEFAPNRFIIKTKTPLSSLSPHSLRTTSTSINSSSYHLSAYSIESIRLLGNKSPSGLSALNRASSSIDNIYVVSLEENSDILTICDALAKKSDIAYVHPDYIYKTQLIPNDSLYASYQADYYTAMNLQDAWDIGVGTANIVVAVIDTGVNWTHEDLSSVIWTNTGETSTNNATDDDNNGYIDDYHGWDFVTGGIASGYSSVSGEDYSTADNNPEDIHGHGTHVSGIVAAQGNNSVGITGVAMGASIMPLRAGYAASYGTSTLGLFYESGIFEAIQYAADNGAHVINMSFGAQISSSSSFNTSLQDAVQYASNKGVVLVAAAGNSSSDIDGSTPFVPASYPEVITVTATDHSGTFDSSYSNYGASVDVAAPGTDIVSTYVSSSNSYALLDGTSMAAPQVAGLAALLLSYDNSLSTVDVKEIIKRSATMKDGSRESLKYGWGLINAKQALAYLSPSSLSSSDDDSVFTSHPDYLLNYPNPFDPSQESASIVFYLTSSSEVTLSIYSMRLGLVKTVATGTYAAGKQTITWDGTDLSGDLVPNGVYPMVLKVTSGTNSYRKTNRVVVLRR